MSRDLTDSAFNEVLQQARSATTVQGDQVDLFGNTEMLNLMVQKGELAARIRRDLMADKNLMKRTAANANRLQEVGNDIDEAATGTLADDTAALLAEFDATKYTEGPTSQLLNEGAEQIANGAKIKPVADRIRRQLIEAAESTPAPAKVAEEVVEEAPQLTRRQKISQIAKTAAEKGEARPPSTPLVDSPDPGRLDVDNDRADVGLMKVLDNEARIADEYAAIDNALAGDKLEAERAAIGYDEMTFEEKKGHGLIDGLQASEAFPQAARAGDEYSEAAIRNRYAGAMEAAEMQKEAELMDIGLKIPSTVAGLARGSERLAKEMVDGMKDAARIAGLDPLKVQYLDEINIGELFGQEVKIQSTEAWDPAAARFMRENPDDPLTDFLDGRTQGVMVPFNYPNAHQGMVYLALSDALDNRLLTPGLKAGAGRLPFGKVAYHEAFHVVQEWLERMSNKADLGAISMGEALNEPAALAEMEKLVKNNRFGQYVEGMSPKELQAEAFAIWYNNRKVRMKAGGVQAAFERMKKFINTLRRKFRYALAKDPNWVDVFELAAEGKVGSAGLTKIKKHTPQQLEAMRGRIDRNMDALLPELTDRVSQYLKQKQQDFDLLAERLAAETELEGC